MRPGWQYIRKSTVHMRGHATQSQYFDAECYIDWVSEVAWSSLILHNDGERIVELRYYMPGNSLTMVEAKTKINFSWLSSSGRALDEYALKLQKGRQSEETMDKVKTVCGEFLELVAGLMKKAEYDLSPEQSRKVIKDKAGEYRAALEDSTFRNVWYLISYHLNSTQPDKLVRVELEGDDFKVWQPVSPDDLEAEQLRRQVIVRSAYLMDAQVLPPNGKLDAVNKPWTVPANVFGQVVGNDLASDLDEISGSVTLRRVHDLQIGGRPCVYLKKYGSSADNRISFLYKPEPGGKLTSINRSVAIDPEQIDIFYDDKQDFQIRRAVVAGKVDFDQARDIKLWPDARLKIAPYLEAFYESKVTARTPSTWDEGNIRKLAPLVKEKIGIEIR
ncbi:MAG: hypothetical protein AAF492_14505, partial [Verrucomicrobiota bacterium]